MDQPLRHAKASAPVLNVQEATRQTPSIMRAIGHAQSMHQEPGRVSGTSIASAPVPGALIVLNLPVPLLLAQGALARVTVLGVGACVPILEAEERGLLVSANVRLIVHRAALTCLHALAPAGSSNPPAEPAAAIALDDACVVGRHLLSPAVQHSCASKSAS